MNCSQWLDKIFVYYCLPLMLKLNLVPLVSNPAWSYMRPLTTAMPPQVSQACQESCVAYLNHCGICKYAQCMSQLEYGRQSQLWLVCSRLQMQRKLVFGLPLITITN